jgi:hypothetical protein
MEININDFERIKKQSEKAYREVKEVFCPYFKEKVAFTHHGLKHLRYRGKENFRPIQDQFMRFKLLHLASEIVRMSNTLQGLLETKKFEKIRIHSRNDMILTPVSYYEFLAIIDRNRVKIILKRIGNGKVFFWSIIPFWGMNRDTMSRILHDGLPEED